MERAGAGGARHRPGARARERGTAPAPDAGRWLLPARGLRRRGGGDGAHLRGRGGQDLMNEEGGHSAGEPQGADGVDEEQFRRQIEEQLKKLRVEDVLLQTVVTLVNLAGRRLTVEEEKDLAQARTGIEAVRALLPLCPQDQLDPVKDALSQLQMIYAREVQQPAEGKEPEGASTAGEDDAERAKARSKLWTPPGT